MVVGRRFANKFRTLELVGGGAFTQVFRGERLEDSLPVAIKVLDPALAALPTVEGRFVREAELSLSLRHPFVVHGYESGVESDGTRFLVLEWLAGETLRNRIDRAGAMDPHEVVRLARQLATALVETHTAGWLHRDLTPNNVFLCKGGSVKLFDYGMAGAPANSQGPTPSEARRLTRAGASVGTLHYSAPEQVIGQTEPRSDLFSLGVLLFEALSGQHPWPVANPLMYLAALREGREAQLPLSQGVLRAPAALCRLVESLVRLDPQARPPSASAALAELLLIR